MVVEKSFACVLGRGLNAMLAGKRRLRGRTDAYALAKRACSAEIMLTLRRERVPALTAVGCGWDWYQIHAAADPDNVAAGKKLVLDALVEALVIPNDACRDVLVPEVPGAYGWLWERFWLDGLPAGAQKHAGGLSVLVTLRGLLASAAEIDARREALRRRLVALASREQKHRLTRR